MIDYDLKKIKAILFDVDGVLSAETILLSSEGEPLRTVNIKDGYAIQLACKVGLRNGLKDEEVMFVGDDIPDLQVMKRVGCACCPKDACDDVKSVSTYISNRIGGHGVGRDVIEQVLRAQGKWLSDEAAFGW